MRSSSVKIASCEISSSAASRSAACGSTEPSVSMSSVSLFEVGALADARLLHGVGHAAHRREDRVDRDHADRLVGRLVVLRRAVARPRPIVR